MNVGSRQLRSGTGVSPVQWDGCFIGRLRSQAGVAERRDGLPDRRDACPTTKRSAFSLIEVMVAILILGVALAGLTHGITTALGSSKESELQTTAMLFAQGKIEELRASKLIVGEDDGDCGAGLDLYRWKQNVTMTDLDGLHDVKVVVENARTGQMICELQTLIFEMPVSLEAAKSKDAKAARKEGGQ